MVSRYHLSEAISCVGRGMRGLGFCLANARECRDFGFVSLYGEVLRLGCFCCFFALAVRPAGVALLSFASPKESKQRKCDPCGALAHYDVCSGSQGNVGVLAPCGDSQSAFAPLIFIGP